MHILVAFFAIFLFFVPSLYAIEFDDYDSLTSHIVKAADNGDAKARYYLVINYLDGKNGFKRMWQSHIGGQRCLQKMAIPRFNICLQRIMH